MNQVRSQKAEPRRVRDAPRSSRQLGCHRGLHTAATIVLFSLFSTVQADISTLSAGDGVQGVAQQVFDAIAMGPVDRITSQASGVEISVLGQTFLTPASDSALAVGDYVVAAGRSGKLSLLLRIGSSYVPGASPIAARGQITAVNFSVASLSIGDLSLDYSPALSSNSGFSPGVGQFIQFTGTQPAFGGIALLTSIQGIHGSGLQGIHGSGLQGIHGSGLQ